MLLQVIILTSLTISGPVGVLGAIKLQQVPILVPILLLLVLGAPIPVIALAILVGILALLIISSKDGNILRGSIVFRGKAVLSEVEGHRIKSAFVWRKASTP
jgi:hypothetical protein